MTRTRVGGLAAWERFEELNILNVMIDSDYFRLREMRPILSLQENIVVSTNGEK